MRILWLKSDYMIPPDTGGKIRSFNLLRQLKLRCDVTYLCLKNNDTPNAEPELREIASEVMTVYRPDEKRRGVVFLLRLIKRMFSPVPYVAQKYRSSKLLELQRDILAGGGESGSESGRRAVLLCDFLDMAENVDWSQDIPKILFEHNVESELWRQYYESSRRMLVGLYCRFEHMRMAAYESRVCNKFDLVFTVSERDKEVLKNRLGVRSRVEVLPTGVDTEFFSPRRGSSVIEDRLVFLGSLDWLPNIDAIRWFLEDIYPALRETRASVSLDIVGRRPNEQLLRLADSDAKIRVLADVPDVRPSLEECSVFVVPLRIGGGTRIKIYEAMAMGLPVVSTSLGAQGLDVHPGENIEIADSVHSLVQGILQLLDDPAARSRMGAAARQHVVNRCSWDRVAQTLHDYCLDLVTDSTEPKIRA